MISGWNSGGENLGIVESSRLRSKMPEEQEEDEMEQVLIPLKNVSPAIPKRESELKELIEDLSRMGCEGLLTKPWNFRAEATLHEFFFERQSMVSDD